MSIFFWQLLFLYRGSGPLFFQFMCIHLLKGDLKFKLPSHASRFWPSSYFRKESSYAIWVLYAFCMRMLLLLRAQSLATVIFFSGSSAHDAPIIFLFHAIILLDVLKTGFLPFAHHCSFFAGRRLTLAAPFLFQLVNAR